MQLRFPRMGGGANTVSLQNAQKNFIEFGASERRKHSLGRVPMELDRKEDQWRLLDPDRDNIEEPMRGIDYSDSYPEADTTVLYYWRSTYWRRLQS